MSATMLDPIDSGEPIRSNYPGCVGNSVPSGAIRHPEWRDRRIGFQPYPFPTYTEELVGLLKETHVEGDLVDDSFVRKVIAGVGGLQAFGLEGSFDRSEVIQA